VTVPGLLDPELEARAREIREKRAADEARAVAARVAAHAEGQSETAELNGLWNKDVAYCTKVYEASLASMAGFDLLDPASPEFTELGEILETLVTVFEAAMRAANARAGQFAALENRATEIANHLSQVHRRQPPPGARLSLRAMWSRLQEQLRGIVAKAADGHHISGERGIFLVDLLRAGLNDAWNSDRRRATLAAAERGNPVLRAKLDFDRRQNPVVLGRGFLPKEESK
jgi:hypothetical protein